MRIPQVILSKAFGKDYSCFLDFTHNYEWMSRIFIPSKGTLLSYVYLVSGLQVREQVLKRTVSFEHPKHV